jgi:hypothetical protein
VVIHNDVHQKLVEMADKQGWNDESMIIHLCGFIQQTMEDEPAYKPTLDDWQRYLEDVAEDEDRQTHNAEEYARAFEDSDSICENCGARCIYDPEMCLCPKCEEEANGTSG